MILQRILDNDMFRSKKSLDAVPLWLETPAKPQFLPAIVSSSRGTFLVSRKLTSESRIRSGVFPYDSDKLDNLLDGLFLAAFALSTREKWNNIFDGTSSMGKAFKYVQNASGVSSQPHMCLIPNKWNSIQTSAFLGSKTEHSVFRKVCKVVACNVSMAVVLSRPDFVGMYTQFLGGKSSIILHNVQHGIAFCV